MEEEPKSSTSVLTSGHVTHCVRERLSTQILKSCAIMKDCTDNLLELSLLFPSAPWVRNCIKLYHMATQFFTEVPPQLFISAPSNSPTDKNLGPVGGSIRSYQLLVSQTILFIRLFYC